MENEPVEPAMMSLVEEEEEGSSISISTTDEQLEKEAEFLDAEEGDDDQSMADETLIFDSDGVITFSMTLQERLLELSEVFDSFANGGLTLQNFWAMYVETYVEPVGWQALLKPRQDLHDLNCSVSSCRENELVEVLQVNCSSLDAKVTRDSAKQDIFEVSLCELYPLAKQENAFLAMRLTAKCIDNYRFFVNHLYLPWDPEDAKLWCEKHLESRIQLYHDLQSGAIPESLSKEITDLMKEAKRNQKIIDNLEDQLAYTDCDGEIDENVVLQLLPIHTRQDEVNLRFSKLENPLWRNVLHMINQAKKRSYVRITEKVVLVADNFTCSELTSDLQFIKSQVGDDEKVSIARSLQEALDSCQPGVKIFLKPGVHAITGLGNLEEGGSIIGIGTDLTEIITKDAGDVWLVANTESSVCLENVKIRVCPMYTPPLTLDDNDILPDKQPACYLAFLVQRGSLKLKNVTLEGFSELGVGCDETETNGIKVIGNGNLTMTNSRVLRFVTGIVVRGETELNMTDSEVDNCVVGIETSSDAKVQLSQIKIMRCLKFGIKVYANVDESIVGSSEVLQTLHNFTTSDILFQDCAAGSACVCPYVRLSGGNSESNK